MISMKKIKRSPLSRAVTLALMVGGIGGVPGAAFSQTAENDEVIELEEVTVYGIRSALQDAISVKRNSDQIVDSISAEDIGKLPDDNVARALARVPGVQITQRGGIGSEIQLRGLSQVFVSLNGTTFVGTPSQQSARDAVRRNVALDDIPSELFAGFDVIKTPTADNIEGGIGGSVNIKTRKPFDLDDQTLAISAEVNYDDLASSSDPSVSVLFGQNNNDKFAYYVNATYDETTSRIDNIAWLDWDDIRLNVFTPGSPLNQSNINEFNQSNPDPSVCNPFCWSRPVGDTGFDPTLFFNNGTEVGEVLAPRQVEARRVEVERETLGLNGSFQWRPNEDVVVTLDTLFTQFEETNAANELRLSTEGQFSDEVYFDPFVIAQAGGGDLGAVVSQDFSLLRGGFRPHEEFSNSGFPQRNAGVVGFRDAETSNIRLNTNWQINDRLNANFNFAYGENTFNSLFLQQELRSGSGNTNGAFNGGFRRPDADGNRPSARPAGGFFYDITGSGIGDLGTSYDLTDRDNFILSFVSLFDDVFETEDANLAADFDLDLGEGTFNTFEFGVRYSTRENSRRVQRGIGQNFQAACNQRAQDDNFQNVTDLDRCINEFGGSFLTADRIGVDPFRELQDTTADQFPITGLIADSITVAGGDDGDFFQGEGGNFVRQFLSGDPTAYEGDPIGDLLAVWGIRPESDPVNDYDIAEDTFAVYGKLKFTGFDDRLAGNVGLRVINTDTTSSAFVVAEGAQQQFLFSQIFDNYDEVTVSDDYWDFLPSLNLRYNLTENSVLRFGAARTLSRANLTDLAPGLFIRSLVDRTAVAGDPGLEPFRATQIDLSYERYLEDGFGLFAIAAFYKDIDSFITTETSTQDLLDGFGNLTPFTVISPVNDSAEVQGVEVTFQRSLDDLISVPGFGVLLNYTYADSDTPSGLSLPELSENSYNAIFFYENNKFSSRIAYNFRDERLFRANGFGNNPEFIKDFGTLDYSMSYNINDSIELTFDAINLTEENLESFTSIEERRLSFQQLGRSFRLGVRGKF